MKFRPRLNQPALLSGQAPRNQLNGVKRKNSNGVLVVRVKVWPMVRFAHLHEHPNDDAEEPTDLWHSRILSTILADSSSASPHLVTLSFRANLGLAQIRRY